MIIFFYMLPSYHTSGNSRHIVTFMKVFHCFLPKREILVPVVNVNSGCGNRRIHILVGSV